MFFTCSTEFSIARNLLTDAQKLFFIISLCIFNCWSINANAETDTSNSQTSKQYNIPAGPLSSVLTQFSTEAGIFLAGATELAEGKSSAGLIGTYSVDEGLVEILSGTGLDYLIDNNGTVTPAVFVPVTRQ
ncbi:MAG: STN domain-containing protein [Pseudomonadota bacterium]